MINIAGLVKVIFNIVLRLILWPIKVNNQWPKLIFYFKILVFAMLFFWQQVEAFYYFSSINNWPNQEIKQYNRSISLYICKLKVE